MGGGTGGTEEEGEKKRPSASSSGTFDGDESVRKKRMEKNFIYR